MELAAPVLLIEKNEMGGASSMYRGEGRLIQGFGENTLKTQAWMGGQY
jgi:hypothetical protein